MTVRERITGAVKWLFIERPASWRNYDDQAQLLETAGKKLSARFAQANDSAKNRDTLRHIVTMERWGQNRIKVGLGENFKPDRSGDYTPDENTWTDLQRLFEETRAETVRLAKELQMQNAEVTMRVQHNDLGEMSLRGWLRYLLTHANLEATRIR